ncbi:MAG: methyltransferase domain-containing protein, partial [Nanoarchaeota archaeon]
YQKGYSDNTNLPEASANLCISAQAFHWFDIEKTNQEIKRILKPGGFCCAFWNVRIKTPFVEEYESLLKVYSSDYEKTPKAKDTVEAIKRFSSVRSFKEKQFANIQNFDQEDLIGRAYSTSYVAHGVKEHDKFRQALRDLFDKYQSQGKVSFTYKTLAICWQLKLKGEK